MDASAQPTGGPLWFDATLHPHRSLSRRGFMILMGILCAISFAAGVAFVSIGAWPVFGFFGLDVLAVYWAFRINYRAGSMVETIRLTDESLVVGRLSPRGAYDEWRFQPFWVRVLVDEPRPHETRVMLASHGKSVEIGNFLSPDERIEVAEALKAALARLRAGTAPHP